MTDTDIRNAIRKAVPRFDVDTLAADKDFAEAGLDSLDHATILLNLLEAHNFVVPDEDVFQCVSIRGILEYAAKWQDRPGF